MSINIEELKRLHKEAPKKEGIDLTGNDWHVAFYTNQDTVSIFSNGYEIADNVNTEDAELICFLRNNCEEIIEALEFSKNRDEAKV